MTTKVIFRVDKRDNQQEIIAFFPAIAGDMNPYRTCQAYVHMGQHITADVHFSEWTHPATEAEYMPLYNELVSIGYDDLKICKRTSQKDLQERINQRIHLTE